MEKISYICTIIKFKTGSPGHSDKDNMTTLRIKEISKKEYNSIKKMDKKYILSGILYRIHGLSEKDDKYTLTNAWFASRYGDFIVI